MTIYYTIELCSAILMKCLPIWDPGDNCKGNYMYSLFPTYSPKCFEVRGVLRSVLPGHCPLLIYDGSPHLPVMKLQQCANKSQVNNWYITVNMYLYFITCFIHVGTTECDQDIWMWNSTTYWYSIIKHSSLNNQKSN